MWYTVECFLVVDPGVADVFVGACGVVQYVFVEDKVVLTATCMPLATFLFIGEEIMLGEVGVDSG